LAKLPSDKFLQETGPRYAAGTALVATGGAAVIYFGPSIIGALIGSGAGSQFAKSGDTIHIFVLRFW